MEIDNALFERFVAAQELQAKSLHNIAVALTRIDDTINQKDFYQYKM